MRTLCGWCLCETRHHNPILKKTEKRLHIAWRRTLKGVPQGKECGICPWAILDDEELKGQKTKDLLHKVENIPGERVKLLEKRAAYIAKKNQPEHSNRVIGRKYKTKGELMAYTDDQNSTKELKGIFWPHVLAGSGFIRYVLGKGL